MLTAGLPTRYPSVPPHQPRQSTSNINVGNNIVLLIHIFIFIMPKDLENLCVPWCSSVNTLDTVNDGWRN